MKRLRVLGPAILASAVGLLAFAGNAMATIITSPTGAVATPTIKAASEGHVVLHNPNGNIECASNIEGNVESHGSATTAKGNVSSLSFTGCTKGWSVTVNTLGSLEVHYTSGYNGVVTSYGTKITAVSGAGFSCVYETSSASGTPIGTITGGTPATLDLSASIPRVGGSFLCGGAAEKLTGSYKVTSPSSLFVDQGIPGTTLTSPTGTAATPTIDAESEGVVLLHNSIANIECTASIEGKIEDHGEEAAASGNLSALSFSGCNSPWVVDLVSPGEIAVYWAGGYDGTVTLSGATLVATHLELGASCRYSTEGIDIGTLTGGSPATLDLKASIPRHGGSFLCGGSTANWTGSFEVASPSSLFVDRAGPIVTSPTGTVATPTIKAASEGHLTLDHPIASIQCNWAFEGAVESHLESVAVPLSSVTTSSCTDSWHATTTSAGKLEIASIGDYDGTVVWDGGTVEMTRLGTTCRYKSDETHLGTITGGSPATVDIAGSIPFHSGSPICGEEAYPLTGSLKVNSPSSLYFD